MQPTEPTPIDVSYRVTAVRAGMLLSWLALIWYVVALATESTQLVEDRASYLIAGFSIALAITVAPWKRLLRYRLGDVLVVMWIAAVAISVLVVPEFQSPTTTIIILMSAAAFGVVGMLAAPATIAAVATITTVFAAAEVIRAGSWSEASWPVVVGFAIAAGLLAASQFALAARLRSANVRMDRASAHESDLARREAEIEQLYEVSRTIGAGSDLSEILPELVGRVVSSVGARTGVVLLYRQESVALEVISPIWVSGHPLKAEGYVLPLSTRGIVQRVFMSSEPLVINELDKQRDRFLAELDAKQLLVVPLQIESRSIGVLLVADKAGGFGNEDAELLQSLAGPSALVLNHLARYEEAKETSEKMAELAQLKTDFVSVVSHELRTPLTSIIGSLSTLQRPELTPTDPSAVELLNTASRQANRLRALIEDLLVVSRIDNQALPVRPEDIDLRTAMDEIVATVPGAAQWTTVDVDSEVSILRADPEHLRRIVTNLVENALRYAPRTSIEVSARRHASDVLISVADHGPGIPYELAEHIFDRFTQVDRHETRSQGGTGLGLSIVRGLSEAMGGRAWYEPTTDGGATFHVTLPMRSGTRRMRTSSSFEIAGGSAGFGGDGVEPAVDVDDLAAGLGGPVAQ